MAFWFDRFTIERARNHRLNACWNGRQEYISQRISRNSAVIKIRKELGRRKIDIKFENFPKDSK